MLLRLLFLISLLGYSTGPDAREEDDEKLGGEGFGTIVMLVAGLGLILLIGLIVLAVMSLMGQFDSDLMDPIV